MRSIYHNSTCHQLIFHHYVNISPIFQETRTSNMKYSTTQYFIFCHWKFYYLYFSKQHKPFHYTFIIKMPTNGTSSIHTLSVYIIYLHCSIIFIVYIYNYSTLCFFLYILFTFPSFFKIYTTYTKYLYFKNNNLLCLLVCCSVWYMIVCIVLKMCKGKDMSKVRIDSIFISEWSDHSRNCTNNENYVSVP